jgi:hypothetical protein
VLELLLAPLALRLLNARHRFRRPASRSRASTRRRSTLGPSGSAPSSSQLGHLVVVAHGPTEDGVLKSFRGGFESREPPLQPSIRGVEPPTSADWKGRNRRTRSITPRAFLFGARRSGAAITRSLLNLFRATDATGRGSRPEVRSGPGTPARRITSPGLQLAYSSGTTTARASLARVSARRRSRARHATGRPHGLSSSQRQVGFSWCGAMAPPVSWHDSAEPTATAG